METQEVEESPEATPINSEVAAGRKCMQISLDCPIHAYQTIVARANPDYIVTLHKLLTTFAECAEALKK